MDKGQLSSLGVAYPRNINSVCKSNYLLNNAFFKRNIKVIFISPEIDLEHFKSKIENIEVSTI